MAVAAACEMPECRKPLSARVGTHRFGQGCLPPPHATHPPNGLLLLASRAHTHAHTLTLAHPYLLRVQDLHLLSHPRAPPPFTVHPFSPPRPLPPPRSSSCRCKICATVVCSSCSSKRSYALPPSQRYTRSCPPESHRSPPVFSAGVRSAPRWCAPPAPLRRAGLSRLPPPPPHTARAPPPVSHRASRRAADERATGGAAQGLAAAGEG
jgi:hypothetical protein